MADSLLTHPSLLLRIRDARDAQAWARFVDLYTPLIHGFARKYGLQEADAADVTQEVLSSIARAVQALNYDPQVGAFRGWLYTVVRNQVRKTLGRRKSHQCGTGGTEAQMLLEQHLSPERDETAEWNANYERHLFAHAATQVRGVFQESIWQAFWLTAVEGEKAKEVAEQLGMTVAAVYLAKGRGWPDSKNKSGCCKGNERQELLRYRMAERTDCPDPSRWQQFLHGDVGEHEKTKLDRHLEDCELCQKTLDGLVADQASWSDMARQLSDAQPEIDRAYERARNNPGDHQAADASLKTSEYSLCSLFFLQPSEKPDSLGRLTHYEILEVIGRGGMGIVLRAFDDKLHRVVAIKVMAPQLAATSPPRKRFLREARAAAIRHEHVVDIHAVEEEPIPYLVMEYVPGENLQQKLDRVGPLEVPEVLRIGEQIARGLAAAHAHGLIHRDIKPANILLESGIDPRVKITDFGLARAADDASLTHSGMIAGTPMFMSPEQARGETADQRTDLFSLGSVLYAMCTGRPPFRASSSLAVLKRVAEDTPRPIREIIPEVPQWLCDIIARLQAKEAARRFQTAKEVADLLGRCLTELKQQGQVISVGQAAGVPEARPPAPSGRLPRGKRRWALAAVGVLLLLGGLSFTEATGVTKIRATVIRIFTGDGTLIVEVNDPGVKVTIEGDGGLVITGAGPHEVRLRPGSYKLQAAKDGKPVPLDQELVTITRGDKQVVRVAVEAKGAAGSEGPRFVTPWSDSDDWVIKGQELYQLDEVSGGLHLILFGDPSWTDYDFEAEAEALAGGTGMGLAFRATRPGRRLDAGIGGFDNTKHVLVKYEEGKGPLAFSFTPGKAEKGRWYKLRVEVRAHRIRFFLDGKRVLYGFCEEYSRGCVGLVTNGCSARFRNMKVTDPGGSVLFEGVQDVLPKPKK